MKFLLTLSLLTALVSGCERETTMTEDTNLMDIVEMDVDMGETTEVDAEGEAIDPEEEEVTSVGPGNELPADLIPSR